MGTGETTGKEMPRQGHVVGELCQKENPLPVHSRMVRQEMGR